MKHSIGLATLMTGVLAMSACGSPAGGESASDATKSGANAATTAATAAYPSYRTVAERCRKVFAGAITMFPGPRASRLSRAVLGSGPDVAVFLHQTTDSGMCGFAPYAEWAATHGLRAVIFDFCGWGGSACPVDLLSDKAAQARAVMGWATANGASRITLVGASMGGAIAIGTGQDLGADAVVDLSGPMGWEGVPDTLVAAAKTTVPLLVAAAGSDTGMDVPGLRKALASAPAQHKRYVAAPAGHGWDMLTVGEGTTPRVTPLGQAVLAWAKGDYAG